MLEWDRLNGLYHHFTISQINVMLWQQEPGQGCHSTSTGLGLPKWYSAERYVKNCLQIFTSFVTVQHFSLILFYSRVCIFTCTSYRHLEMVSVPTWQGASLQWWYLKFKMGSRKLSQADRVQQALGMHNRPWRGRYSWTLLQFTSMMIRKLMIIDIAGVHKLCKRRISPTVKEWSK